MNWGTLVQKILLSSGQPANQADHVKNALIEAMDELRHEHFWFNEVAFNFTLTAGTSQYGVATSGFPTGLLKILGEYLFLDLAGSADSRYPIERRDHEYIEAMRAAGPFQAQPELWSFFNQEIHLYPTPSSSTDVLRGRAVVDQWVPISRYESGAWKFYKPSTTSFVVGNELTDAYPASPDVNPWISNTEVAAMIRHYAENRLWSTYWQATDDQADRSLLAFTQARAAVESRTTQLLAPLQIAPYPIGGFR